MAEQQLLSQVGQPDVKQAHPPTHLNQRRQHLKQDFVDVLFCRRYVTEKLIIICEKSHYLTEVAGILRSTVEYEESADALKASCDR
jgi:hypothetical protein